MESPRWEGVKVNSTGLSTGVNLMVMRFRPSVGFVIVMALLLAPVPFGVWAWAKASSVRANFHPGMPFLEALRFEEPLRAPELTPEQIAEGRRIADKQRARMLAMFPDLAVTPHPVPDEENAFLQLHLIEVASGRNEQPFLPSELRDWSSPLDIDAARELLELHSDWVKTAEHLASLTKSSSSNMPESFDGFVGARTAMSAADHLLLKAQLAAEEGDEEGALRLVGLARNIGGHYRDVERPSLMGETITILVDLSALDATNHGILPALGPSADLAGWRTVLASRCTPKALAHTMRGEWFCSLGMMTLYLAHPETTPPDPDRLVEVFTERFSREAKRLDQATLSDLHLLSGSLVHESSHGLSEKSSEILNWFSIGGQAWYRGFTRAALKHAHLDAGLELLQREQHGEDLTTLTACDTINPLTNEPFEFDPVTRTLPEPNSPDDHDLLIDPLPLPW